MDTPLPHVLLMCEAANEVERERALLDVSVLVTAIGAAFSKRPDKPIKEFERILFNGKARTNRD